jgi:3'-phosphoadenosine 5'-phosphosulfate sulfotransferase (PAPS reductase)/FAD synthetase
VSDTFFITGPALISFSGGRTSAYMLWKILQAHGGALPDDVHVTFANTGKEREETLRFVHECGVRWGVSIVWLEWVTRRKRVHVSDRFRTVGYNSASRNGEPFAALVADKKYTPNGVSRFCTEHLKVQVMADYMESLGYGKYANVVGLRADEMRRAAKVDIRNDDPKARYETVLPLVRAGIRKEDVARFWHGDVSIYESVERQRAGDFRHLPQGFDLGLHGWEGNCDNCFLKGRKILLAQAGQRPESFAWWIEQERRAKGDFNKDFSYESILDDVEKQVPLFGDDVEFDSECGVSGVDTRVRCGSRP